MWSRGIGVYRVPRVRVWVIAVIIVFIVFVYVGVGFVLLLPLVTGIEIEGDETK